MEDVFAEAAKVFFTSGGLAGAVAIIAIVALFLAVKELRNTWQKWLEDRNVLQEKRLDEMRALQKTMDGNTAAMLDATRTAEARAAALTRLSEAVTAQNGQIEELRRAVTALTNEVLRRGGGQ